MNLISYSRGQIPWLRGTVPNSSYVRQITYIFHIKITALNFQECSQRIDFNVNMSGRVLT